VFAVTTIRPEVNRAFSANALQLHENPGRRPRLALKLRLWRETCMACCSVSVKGAAQH